MKPRKISDNVDGVEKTISSQISKVLERGIDEIEVSEEDYSQLIEQKFCKDQVIYELYESYFLPKRHEFEFSLISEIVNAVIQSKITIFIAGAALSGFIGDYTTSIVKRLLTHIINEFRTSKKEKEKFKGILNDVEKIETFFGKKNKEEISRLIEALGIEKERLIP